MGSGLNETSNSCHWDCVTMCSERGELQIHWFTQDTRRKDSEIFSREWEDDLLPILSPLSPSLPMYNISPSFVLYLGVFSEMRSSLTYSTSLVYKDQLVPCCVWEKGWEEVFRQRLEGNTAQLTQLSWFPKYILKLSYLLVALAQKSVLSQINCIFYILYVNSYFMCLLFLKSQKRGYGFFRNWTVLIFKWYLLHMQ